MELIGSSGLGGASVSPSGVTSTAPSQSSIEPPLEGGFVDDGGLGAELVVEEGGLLVTATSVVVVTEPGSSSV